MYDKADFGALSGTNRNHVKCLRISVNIAGKRGSLRSAYVWCLLASLKEQIMVDEG